MYCSNDDTESMQSQSPTHDSIRFEYAGSEAVQLKQRMQNIDESGIHVSEMNVILPPITAILYAEAMYQYSDYENRMNVEAVDEYVFLLINLV